MWLEHKDALWHLKYKNKRIQFYESVMVQWECCAQALTVQSPAGLMAQSSRWLFPLLDLKWGNPGRLLRNHTPSISFWRILCSAHWHCGMTLTIPCRHLMVTAIIWPPRGQELCWAKGLGLFQVIQDRLVKVGKAYSGWLGSETKPPAS